MLLQFIIGTILGFAFWKIFAGKNEGDKSERSLRFLISGYYVHLHHWLISFSLMIILSVSGFDNFLILGLLFGSILQGLTYRDWYYVVYHRDNYEKIYYKFKNK